MKIDRRTFVIGGVAVAVGGLPWLLRSRRPRPASALKPDPEGTLNVREGFSYRVLERTGQPMNDGYRVPGAPDGMACFPGKPGQLVLMRNHEITRSYGKGAYASGEAPKEAYDPETYGGVTRLIVNAESLERVSSNLVLTGTLKNCCGGPSPWGWLSCEETVDRGHGYVFVCKLDAEGVQPAERVIGYGRFTHEAACVDPVTNAAYLTEDRGDGCFYRFLPHDPKKPFDGTLQALKIVGRSRFDSAIYAREGQKLPVEWVDIDDVDPAEDTIRQQGQERGAAIFRRCEGTFFHDGAAYFAATNGGPKDRGQIYKLTVGRSGPDSLECIAQSHDEDVIECPDNITVTPWGDVVFAEDGPGGNFVRGLTPNGLVYDIAQNVRSKGEIAGVCFSPDGTTLFLNLQWDGLTIAIRGPFSSLGRAAPARSA